MFTKKDVKETMKIQVLEIYEHNILFHTDYRQYQLLLPRSLFPPNIKKGNIETLSMDDNGNYILLPSPS